MEDQQEKQLKALRAELDAACKRLDDLEAERANPKTSAKSISRRAVPRGLAMVLISLAALILLSGSLLYGKSGLEALFIDKNGKVGIGTTTPTTKLDVNGGAAFSGNVTIAKKKTLEFGAGVSGKQSDAGKIGYKTFSGDALDIVGAGTAVTA